MKTMYSKIDYDYFKRAFIASNFDETWMDAEMSYEDFLGNHSRVAEYKCIREDILKNIDVTENKRNINANRYTYDKYGNRYKKVYDEYIVRYIKVYN